MAVPTCFTVLGGELNADARSIKFYKYISDVHPTFDEAFADWLRVRDTSFAIIEYHDADGKTWNITPS